MAVAVISLVVVVTQHRGQPPVKVGSAPPVTPPLITLRPSFLPAGFTALPESTPSAKYPTTAQVFGRPGTQPNTWSATMAVVTELSPVTHIVNPANTPSAPRGTSATFVKVGNYSAVVLRETPSATISMGWRQGDTLATVIGSHVSESDILAVATAVASGPPPASSGFAILPTTLPPGMTAVYSGPYPAMTSSTVGASQSDYLLYGPQTIVTGSNFSSGGSLAIEAIRISVASGPTADLRLVDWLSPAASTIPLGRWKALAFTVSPITQLAFPQTKLSSQPAKVITWSLRPGVIVAVAATANISDKDLAQIVQNLKEHTGP